MLIDKYIRTIKAITDSLPDEVISVFLFGSVANKCIHEGSDIDLCLILANRDDELENSIIRMAKEISNDIDIDLVFYSEEIFNKYKDINGSFVSKVLQGIKLW